MQHLIIDTDLGLGAPHADIDDGFAIAVALADPDIHVDMISTVNGNTPVDRATELSHALLHQLRRDDIPLYPGASASIAQRPGRDDDARGTITKAWRAEAPTQIANWVAAHPQEITILAIGPLTNIAAALTIYPGLASDVKELVIMGGAFLRSTSDSELPGEFNVWVDPDAAAAVLRSNIPQRWVGLDVTLRTRLRETDARALQTSNSGFSRVAGNAAIEWMAHLQTRMRPDLRVASPNMSCAMHDPLALCAITHPEYLTWASARVSVTSEPAELRGVMITDLLRHPNSAPPNCTIAVDVDAPKFERYLLTSLATLN